MLKEATIKMPNQEFYQVAIALRVVPLGPPPADERLKAYLEQVIDTALARYGDSLAGGGEEVMHHRSLLERQVSRTPGAPMEGQS